MDIQGWTGFVVPPGIAAMIREPCNLWARTVARIGLVKEWFLRRYARQRTDESGGGGVYWCAHLFRAEGFTMMHNFLANNRDELIARCKAKVAQRPTRAATPEQLANGVPLFLDQLIRTLEAESNDDGAESLRISGRSGGDAQALSELGLSASAHGGQLLRLGYSVDQVVHDYGDLCQAITDFAFERDAPFAIDEFRTLNRCLDNAIADAVKEFSHQRESIMAIQQTAEGNVRLGFLLHELRNSLSTATLAVSALELGNMTMTGATGAVLKRSLSALTSLVNLSLADVRVTGPVSPQATFSLALFIADAQGAAELDATAKGCTLTVTDVDPGLALRADRERLLAALANLLHNAFKFTHRHTEVVLSAFAVEDRIFIEVRDHCGGLPHGSTEKMFAPFSQHGQDRSGLGLGLAIARQGVQADQGLLTVRDVPGTGCVFTMSLPRHALE